MNLTMSLEVVDARSHGVPILVPRSNESDKVFHSIALPGTPPPPSLPKGKENHGPGKTVLGLITALIVTTALAAVSAGLAGSYAKKRTQAVDECLGSMQ